ncbi:SIR2 family protein [Arthrobacter sp. UNC362MFTsu5.1]|uniref:SIR2 family protein n=1 Tax=Arthrobacter sp. UNC362MFTsu5.1 TaxID=1449044 RepID=UPI001E539B9B|nr:SIR2 family protein [Arthrobacter sp. UNC362MFTsu5.1]
MGNGMGVWLGGEVVDEPSSDQSSERIKSWLAALLDGEHLSLLTGNGLTTGVAFNAGLEAPSMVGDSEFGNFTQQVLEDAAATSARMGRGDKPNIEDKLRSAQTVLDGLAIIQPDQNETSVLKASVEAQFELLLRSVLDFERALRGAVGTEKYQTALNSAARFLLAFAARPGGRERLNLFTTNYDRLLEHLCDQLGLRPLDRFVGGLEPKFRASRLDVDMHYNPPGARGEPRYLEGVLHLGKLHGSLDWKWSESQGVHKTMVPFGAKLGTSPSPWSQNVLIYPRSTKDIETQLYPYAELFRDFASAVCRPHSVLFTFGYGFGDSHVNRIIQDMLTIPSTHVVVCSFDASQSIDSCLGEFSTNPQISAFVGPQYATIDAIGSWLPRLSSEPLVRRQGNYRSTVDAAKPSFADSSRDASGDS